MDRSRKGTLGGRSQAAVGVPAAAGKNLLAGGALLALALLAAMSWGSASAEAVFPGQNGRLACQGLRGPNPAPAGQSRTKIFSVNPDGTDERVLTPGTPPAGTTVGAERDPAFSPDGTKIAFAAQRNNVTGEPANTEVYIANNDGDLVGPDLRRLTFNDGTLANGTKNGVAATDQSPSWSPDGTQIVFHSGRENTFPAGTGTPNRFEIYRMSATTGEQGGLVRLTNNRVQDAIPAWSPDGGKISFQSLSVGNNPFNLEIFTMNPDGTEVTNISNNPGTTDNPLTTAREDSDAIDSFGTAWSPDGRQLAFGSTRDTRVAGNQNFEVYKVNRDGSNPTRLTLNRSGDTPDPEPFQDYDQAPTWSPDGKRILFHSGRTSTAAGDVFLTYTMDAQLGEAGGLQSVAETDVFARCDWQAIRPAQVTPPPTYPGPYPTPTPRPTPGGKVRPNLIRPGFARAVQPRRRRAGRRVVVQLRGRMLGNQGRPCGGRLKIGTRAGGRRVATRFVRMGRNCRYRARYSFAVRQLPRRLRPRNRRLVLTIVLRFQGNSGLTGDTSPPKRVRVRR